MSGKADNAGAAEAGIPVGKAGNRIPADIWALGFVSMFMDISSEMIHALLPVYMVAVLGTSALAVGLIEGVAEATASITKIFSGALSDWLGRRKLLAVLGYGLGALSKPIFPLASSLDWLVAARFVDRVGKGIRGAPRDALVADITPPHLRGASFGLRQSLDTIGAFMGPLLAIGLTWLTANDFQAVFWVAVIPAFLAVGVLAVAVKEPPRPKQLRRVRMPLHVDELRRLGAAYWWVVAIAAVFTLARFSEAFLILRAQSTGLPLALIPIVLMLMSLAYALSAYPVGVLADRVNSSTLLIIGLVLLLLADLVLAFATGMVLIAVGVVLWGLHMGFTQGLLAALITGAAPAELRGTAFGVFNLVSGLSLLLASIVAGALWDIAGPKATFLAGAGFTVLTLIGFSPRGGASVGLAPDHFCGRHIGRISPFSCATDDPVPKAPDAFGGHPVLKPSRDKHRENRSSRPRSAGARPRDQVRAEAPAAQTPAAREPRQSAAPRVKSRREGALPAEKLPVILEVAPDENYALLDSGGGAKLEQYGPYRIVRPEGQAIWQRALPDREWERADAIFTGDTDEEGMGRWRFPKTPLGETWPMRHDGIDYLGRFTSFRHVGVFPEQASHWDHMAGLILTAKRPVKVLNLFGYTGLASLVAAKAGAEVTHVDASKKAIGWARENQDMAGLAQKPIRWILEDAMKFVEREERRGNSYDIILFDPPAYGRGPKGEVWQLFDDLPDMADLCRSILSPRPLAVVLTAYSIRASFFAIHALMRDTFAGMGGKVESGELVIREKSAGRALSTSLFSRWVAA